MRLYYPLHLIFFAAIPLILQGQNVPFDPLQFVKQEEEFNVAVEEYNEGDQLFSKGPAYYHQALEKY